MPRNGKGQKVQTATGQQYGSVKEQEEAQAQMPLPNDVALVSKPKPGSMSLAMPSQRPSEPVTAPTAGIDLSSEGPSLEQRRDALNLLIVMEAMPNPSPSMRNTIRRLKMFVGDMSQMVMQ